MKIYFLWYVVIGTIYTLVYYFTMDKKQQEVFNKFNTLTTTITLTVHTFIWPILVIKNLLTRQ